MKKTGMSPLKGKRRHPFTEWGVGPLFTEGDPSEDQISSNLEGEKRKKKDLKGKKGERMRPLEKKGGHQKKK